MNSTATRALRRRRLSRAVRIAVARLFRQLDYAVLAQIYCDEGGAAFWNVHRGPCERLGLQLAERVLNRLVPGGQSLYVGAGVAELPIMAMERMELNREVEAFTLRRSEASVLNRACRAAQVPVSIHGKDADGAEGWFDHLWIVSVLNDPERFPELAALSYGRANPATFDPVRFSRERRKIRAIVDHSLKRLRRPALVTTSVEEIPWITEWCARRHVSCLVEPDDYPTAIVKDPICFIRIGRPRTRRPAS